MFYKLCFDTDDARGIKIKLDFAGNELFFRASPLKSINRI